MSEWIDVKERLPKSGESVLVRVKDSDRRYTDVWEYEPRHPYFRDKLRRDKTGVTHWMPLPEPPSGERGKG